jgi:peptide/nickel transport system substrate-binding protein
MHVDTAQVIANQLERIGVNTSIRLVDWSTWLSEVYRDKNYQATIISVDSRTISPRGFLARYRSDDGGNFFNFNSADFNRVYDAAVIETDNVNRIRLYREAQRIITENATNVYIQDILYFIALRGGVFGGALNYPLYIIDFASIYGINNN